MKECQEIGNLLVAYTAHELTEKEMRRVSEHLDRCSSCLNEYQQIGQVFSGIETLRDEHIALIEGVDWEEKAREFRAFSLPRPRPAKKSFFFGWRILVPASVSLFILGLLLGYFLFHNERAANVRFLETDTAALSFGRLENTLARKEILDFLKQTRLLFTELMVKCDQSGLVLVDSKMKRDQINSLLIKSRYLGQDLHDPLLMSSRNLLAEIELLLYEISTIDENSSCQSIQSLQQSIQQQRLFFKMRLIEKELTLFEV